MKEKEIYLSEELYEILLEEERKHPPHCFKSGLPALDSLVGDFRGGDITVISGKTGHGKTTLAITITKNMARFGNNALWFSYEMGTLEFLRKTLDYEGSIPDFYLPMHLIPNKLDYIDFKIKEAKKEITLSAVFIDHLHYLCDLQDVKMAIEISRVMRWLKTKAVQHDVAIFLVAHVHKLQDVKLKDLDNDHLKDSSAIAQEADNVFFIVREGDDNKARLKITKNRRFGIRNKYINLVKVRNYLEEASDDTETTDF